MREDTKRRRLEAKEFDDQVMNGKEPTNMPAWFCVVCSGDKSKNECDCNKEE